MSILDKIEVSKRVKGKSKMTSGDEYEITATYNGNTIKFSYNDNYMNNSDKRDFLYALMSDADAYCLYSDFDDFVDEFGYDDPKQAYKAYKGCKDLYYKASTLFDEEEWDELLTELELR